MTDLRQLVADTAPEDLPALVGKLAEAQAVAMARLTTAVPSGESARGDGRNLSAKEAARRLGVSVPYLYKHTNEFPFAVRIGKRVVFDSRGLEAWNNGQRPTLTSERQKA